MMKIYCDSDGVLVNWVKAVQELGPGPAQGLVSGATPDQKQVMYKAVEAAGPDFWANLEWLEGGQELWALISKLSLNPTILTAPGLFTGAEKGKKEWVRKNLPGATIIVENEKSQYAELDAVLIDDMAHNVAAWQEAGGIGILHKSFPETESALMSLLWNRPSVNIT